MKRKETNAFKTMSYTLRTMFEMDKIYLFLLFLSMVILSVIPLLNANLVSLVINIVVEYSRVDIAVFAAVVILLVIILLKSLDAIVMWNRSNHFIKMSHNFDIFLAQKTLNMKYENAENSEISDLRMKAARGCSSVPKIAEGITDLGANLIKILSCAAVFTMFHPMILVLVIICSLFSYLVSEHFQKLCYENENKEYRINRKINYYYDNMLDIVAGKEIRVFSASHFFRNKYLNEETQLYSLQKSTQAYIFLSQMFSIVIVSIQSLILYLYTTREYYGGNALIGDVIFYINLALVFTEAFSGIFTSVISINLEGNRLNAFRDYMNIDSEEKQGSLINTDHVEIVFDHVWFKYKGSEDYVIKDISFTVREGEKLAVVGENGSGKTTLIKLLLRLYTPTKGRILFNGIDYLTINQENYYRMFSTVFQDFHLLAFTVKENLDFTGVRQDEERMREVLERIDLKDKLDKLPDGLATYITQEYEQNGVDFSGGERQKLAIARADYKNASILILDEPTSALDPIAEKKLYDYLYKLMDNKTMIMISHRLQSTSICDEIILISDGRKVEQGTHDELMKNDGLYAKMYDLQADWYKKESYSPGKDSYNE